METLLPNVDYVALRDINYRTFVRAVLEANSPRQITLQEMQLIWDTLVYKVFRFECACAKEGKANEVFLSRRLTCFLSLKFTRAWELIASVKHSTFSLPWMSGPATLLLGHRSLSDCLSLLVDTYARER